MDKPLLIIGISLIVAGVVVGVTQTGPKPGTSYYQIGVASWYGPNFHGKKTANGEIYNMHEMTAAHKSLPFNTIVQVVDLETGKSVRVRINDRGPFIKNRILDLSRKAADKLEIIAKGTTKVGLKIVKWGDGVSSYQR